MFLLSSSPSSSSASCAYNCTNFYYCSTPTSTANATNNQPDQQSSYCYYNDHGGNATIYNGPDYTPVNAHNAVGGDAVEYKVLDYEINATCIKSDQQEESHIKLTFPFPSPSTAVRQQRRRERNKVAATRCRHKKKLHVAQLNGEHVHLVRANAQLKLQLQQLNDEQRGLVAALDDHTKNNTISGSCYLNFNLDNDHSNLLTSPATPWTNF